MCDLSVPSRVFSAHNKGGVMKVEYKRCEAHGQFPVSFEANHDLEHCGGGGFGYNQHTAWQSLVRWLCVWCFSEYDGCVAWRLEHPSELFDAMSYLVNIERKSLVDALSASVPEAGHPFEMTADGYPVGLEL